MDTVMNCFLFLLGVLPSHVHSFYISFVYYSRKRKARKGRYPGPPHSFIYSDKINNGDLTNAEVEKLWYAEHGTGNTTTREGRRSEGGRKTTRIQRHPDRDTTKHRLTLSPSEQNNAHHERRRSDRARARPASHSASRDHLSRRTESHSDMNWTGIEGRFRRRPNDNYAMNDGRTTNIRHE